MMRETPPANERQLLDSLERLLTGRLPGDWVVGVEREPRSRQASPDRWLRPDGWLTVSPPASLPATFLIEAKLALYPRDASSLTRQLAAWPTARSTTGSRPGSPGAAALLVVSRFLTPRTREILRSTGISYADATGNLRLESRDPALFVELTGATTNPWVADRPLQSLQGPGTARVVRALLDHRPPYTLRELAQAADLPLATASRVVSYLAEEGLVSREGRGPIVDVAWQELLRQWAAEYSLLDANQVEFFLEPRGPRALVKRLRDIDIEYAVTGSLAAEQKASFAPAALASVYVRDIRRAADALGLRPAPSGGNVLLISPGSDVAFVRSWTDGATSYAAVSQVAADLLSAPGRAPSEAEALIEWMERNEDAWRRP